MSDDENETKEKAVVDDDTAVPTRKSKSERKRERKSDAFEPPSVTMSLFLYWILPVLVIACMTRFVVDPDAAHGIGMGTGELEQYGIKPGIPVQQEQQMHPTQSSQAPSHLPTTNTPTNSFSQTKPERPKRKPTPVPTLVARKPTSYQEAVKAIYRRRLDWDNVDASPMEGQRFDGGIYDDNNIDGASPSATRGSSNNKGKSNGHGSTTTKNKRPSGTERDPRGASTDVVRIQLNERIDQLRKDYEEDPDDLLKLIQLADALRLYDVKYHDGGTTQEEAIDRYKTAISMASKTRQRKLELGEDTKSANVAEEITLDNALKSIDGILCTLHTALGKVYFMANMFELAVECYTDALEVEPYYLDAMASRGSSRIILGKYEDAARDFMTVMELDRNVGMFVDVYTGLARILQARESAVPTGWEPMVQNLSEMIPAMEQHYTSLSLHGNSIEGQLQTKIHLATTLNRFLHVMFMYHDVKTKDTDAAWEFLSRAFRYKMSTLSPWKAGFEKQKVVATKHIFKKGFWPDGIGSDSAVPIFIIGFVRSGSTLLERVLDAHPQIVGTGENSVFNGRLDHIRNKIVESSLTGDTNALGSVINSLANGVVDEMRYRWKMVASADSNNLTPAADPKRFADKMLTNYNNVGFIHMLFPNALILHVIREPMDTIFSAYKHEFPSGPLDYTSDFEGLAEFYHAYRDLMDHWDRELPGRVTHVRYEDMVHDMPGVAKKIIEATGLDWDDSVLDFHKKKHAVNTLSTTQVRKGVYKDSLQAWTRYETHLDPLVDLIGDRTTYDIQTSLLGYERPSPSESDAVEDSGDDDETEEESVVESSPIESAAVGDNNDDGETEEESVVEDNFDHEETKEEPTPENPPIEADDVEDNGDDEETKEEPVLESPPTESAVVEDDNEEIKEEEPVPETPPIESGVVEGNSNDEETKEEAVSESPPIESAVVEDDNEKTEEEPVLESQATESDAVEEELDDEKTEEEPVLESQATASDAMEEEQEPDDEKTEEEQEPVEEETEDEPVPGRPPIIESDAVEKEQEPVEEETEDEPVPGRPPIIESDAVEKEQEPVEEETEDEPVLESPSTESTGVKVEEDNDDEKNEEKPVLVEDHEPTNQVRGDEL